MRKLTYLAVFETGKGDIVVPVIIYPDITKDEINSRREKTTVTIPH